MVNIMIDSLALLMIKLAVKYLPSEHLCSFQSYSFPHSDANKDSHFLSKQQSSGPRGWF